MQNPLRLTMTSACKWSILSGFLLVKAAGLCFLLAKGIFKFYDGIFYHWRTYSVASNWRDTNAAVQQSIQLSSLGRCTPHVISYSCKKMRIHIICRLRFCTKRRGISFFIYETGGASDKNVKSCRIPFFRPRSLNCRTTLFEINLVTQSHEMMYASTFWRFCKHV